MKKSIKITSYILSFALFLSIFVNFAPSAVALSDPDIKASSAILVESETGQVLYSKNEKAKAAPASLTKIMTTLLAIEAYSNGEVSLNSIVTISDDIYSDITPDGSTQDLKTGEQISFENLLYLALMASANEACNAIAEYISGDITAFVNLMNSKAMELGCTSTHFANTHGMPCEDHYTSAYDLYLITREAMNYPLFAKIVATESYTVPVTNLHDERVLKNTNKLLDKNSAYYYEYATGIKTGYTDAAGYCLASAAEKEDMKLISIVLGAESVVIENGTTQVQSFSESKRLLKWGFENFSYQTIISPINLIAEVPVSMGDGADSVVLCPAKQITALLPNDVDVSGVEITSHIYSAETGEELRAPIAQGETLGEATVSLNGVSYGTVPLVANTAVEMNKAKFLKSEIQSTLSNRYVRFTIIGLFILLFAYITFLLLYNSKRRQKRDMEKALAQERINKLQREASLTTGMSFDEIEKLYQNVQK